MAEKTVKSRIQVKRGTSAEWALATNFVPKEGEIIFYSDLNKMKIGDGSTLVSSLPFLHVDKSEIDNWSHNHDDKYYTDSEIDAKLTAFKKIIPLSDNGSTTAGTWLAKTDQISSYTDGQLFLYKVTVAGASTTTLNISGLGAKTIYRGGSTKLTTHYGVGSYVLLYYSSSLNSGSFIVVNDYASDSDKKTSSSDTSSKIFLVGATSQSSSGQATYSHDTVYVGTDGYLYSNSKKVDPDHTHDGRYYTESESDSKFAPIGHTHTTTIAASSGTNELTLAHGTKYAITAGGDSFVFTMPSDNNTWRPIGTGADDAAAGNHNHDDRYYTESEIDTKLAGKSNTDHTHNYAGSSSAGGAANSVKTALTFSTSGNGAGNGTTYNGSTARTISYNSVGAAAASHKHTISDVTDFAHNHDDRYYTESEVDTKLTGKADSSHTHTITAAASDDDVVVLTGTNGTDKVTYSASHANSGVTAGTYKSVTVNAKGHVTAGSNPTTIAEFGITNAYTKSEVDALLAEKGSDDHVHGNITSDGKLGTASRVVVTDGSKNITVSSSITTTELGYLDGVSSNLQTQLDGKLPKLTYEWSKEYNAGGTAGYLLIGSFPMYDSNLTIDIDSTTTTTYHGTVIIATQNVAENSIGTAHTIEVYGDPTGAISSAIRVVWNSGSRNYNVYFVPSTWSKNFIHIRAMGNYLENTDESKICTQFTTGTAPSTTSGLTVENKLTSTVARTTGASNTSSKIYLVGATSQATSPQTYSHDTAYVGTDGCLYSNSKKTITTANFTFDSSSGTLTIDTTK